MYIYRNSIQNSFHIEGMGFAKDRNFTTVKSQDDPWLPVSLPCESKIYEHDRCIYAINGLSNDVLLSDSFQWCMWQITPQLPSRFDFAQITLSHFLYIV